MDEELSEHYHANAEYIRKSSWDQAFAIWAVFLVGGSVLGLVIHAMIVGGAARAAVLIVMGLGGGFVGARYANMWWRLRELKIETAKRAMLK